MALTTTRPLPPYQPAPHPSKSPSRPPRAHGYVAVVQQHPLVLVGPCMRVIALTAILFALLGMSAVILPLTQSEVVLLLIIPVLASIGGIGWLGWRNHQRRHTKLYFSQAGIRLHTPQNLWLNNDLMLPREQCEIELVQNIFEKVLNIGSIVVSTGQRQVKIHWLQGFNQVQQYVDWQIYT